MSLVPVLGALLPGVNARVLGIRGGFSIHGRPRGFSWFPGPVTLQPSPAEIAAVGDRIADDITRYTDRAVLLGFSQGMCAAVTVLRRRPALVRGLVALSGFTWPAGQPADAALAEQVRLGRGVPAFYGRDPADPAIPALASGVALEFLRAHTQLTERSYPGMGHGVGFAEVGDVVSFLRPLLTSR